MRCPKCHAFLPLSQAPAIFFGRSACVSCGSQLRASASATALLTTFLLLCWLALRRFDWFASFPYWLRFGGYALAFFSLGIALVAAGAVGRSVALPGGRRQGFYLLALICGVLFAVLAALSLLGSAT